MPPIEFVCDKCGKTVEVFASKNDLSWVVLCCDQPMKQLYGLFSFVVE